jgi:hypothetical protein
MEYDKERYKECVPWMQRLNLKEHVKACRRKLKRLLKEHPEWKEKGLDAGPVGPTSDATLSSKTSRGNAALLDMRH